MNDCDYMSIALQLAEKGAGWTAPNPMVGAVIVKDCRIIGTGYHERYGSFHAERNALHSCTESPRGAVMYVTLEPCCHYGKQPPCVEAIIEAGISRVAVGSADPNPLVCSKGIRTLREHGVCVTENILKEECDRLNEVFFHYIKTKQPFVVMKYAMTMDGKIAAYTGASRWITGEAARNHVQRQRHRYSSIMAGVGTVIASCCADNQKIRLYQEAGCTVLTLPEKHGHMDLQELMRLLGQQEIDSVLLEGGGTLNWAALESGIVQKVQTYIAPKLLGGQTAKTPVEGAGFPAPADSILLKNSRIAQLGEDILLESWGQRIGKWNLPDSSFPVQRVVYGGCHARNAEPFLAGRIKAWQSCEPGEGHVSKWAFWRSYRNRTCGWHRQDYTDQA